MSDPTRLRDDGSDRMHALLRDAPRSRPRTAEQRARTTARVTRLATVAVVAGGLAWLPAAALGAGLGVATLLVADVVTSRFSATPTMSIAPRPPPTGVSAAALEGTVRAAPSIERAPVVAPRAGEVPARTPSRRLEAVAAPSDELAPAPRPLETDMLVEEATLLDQARALLGGDPAGALALTRTHAERFPGGKLSMERELLAVEALRRLSRPAEARARGEALLARGRGSFYEERVRKILDGMR